MYSLAWDLESLNYDDDDGYFMFFRSTGVGARGLTNLENVGNTSSDYHPGNTYFGVAVDSKDDVRKHEFSKCLAFTGNV